MLDHVCLRRGLTLSSASLPTYPGKIHECSPGHDATGTGDNNHSIRMRTRPNVLSSFVAGMRPELLDEATLPLFREMNYVRSAVAVAVRFIG